MGGLRHGDLAYHRLVDRSHRRTSALRVDVAGSPAIDGLTLATTGDHVLVLGGARTLFEAAAGLRATARGELLVEGNRLGPRYARASWRAHPSNPPMPPKWTVLQYATWSARLAGHGRAPAQAMALEALERMQLDRVAGTKLGHCRCRDPPWDGAGGSHRGRGRDAAHRGSADGPTRGGSSSVRACRRTRSRRASLRGLRGACRARIADRAGVGRGDRGRRIARGGAGTARRRSRRPRRRSRSVYTAMWRRFARAVEAAGGRVELTAGAPAPVYMRVELGPLAARDLLRIAAEAQTVVVELRPLSRAFA